MKLGGGLLNGRTCLWDNDSGIMSTVTVHGAVVPGSFSSLRS